jgi:hypothetical protein
MRRIFKVPLWAVRLQALKDAIDGLGRYLRKSLGEALDGSGGSSGIGSLLSGLLGAFGGTKLSGKSGVGNLTGSTTGYAAGGGSMSGPRWVGEEGRELDLGGGTIMNRRQLQFAMGGGGSSVSIGDTNIVVQGNADNQTLAALPVILQQNNKKLLEEVNRRMKDNTGRGLR